MDIFSQDKNNLNQNVPVSCETIQYNTGNENPFHLW